MIKEHVTYKSTLSDLHLTTLHVFSDHVVYSDDQGNNNTIDRRAFEEWLKHGFLKAVFRD